MFLVDSHKQTIKEVLVEKEEGEQSVEHLGKENHPHQKLAQSMIEGASIYGCSMLERIRAEVVEERRAVEQRRKVVKKGAFTCEGYEVSLTQGVVFSNMESGVVVRATMNEELLDYLMQDATSPTAIAYLAELFRCSQDLIGQGLPAVMALMSGREHLISNSRSIALFDLSPSEQPGVYPLCEGQYSVLGEAYSQRMTIDIVPS